MPTIHIVCPTETTICQRSMVVHFTTFTSTSSGVMGFQVIKNAFTVSFTNICSNQISEIYQRYTVSDDPRFSEGNYQHKRGR